MTKILIKIYKGREFNFSVVIGSGKTVFRKTGVDIFYRVERRLLGTNRWGKNRFGDKGVHLYVKYPGSGHNDGIYASSKELLYALACFLEDYLPISYAKIKYKRFLKE